jgi:hypothetical protein
MFLESTKEGDRAMTVGELKALLADVPDHVDVLVWDMGIGGLDGAVFSVQDNADGGATISHVEISTETMEGRIK